MLTPFIQFFAAVAVVGIIWYGGMSVIDGAMTAGALIAFLIYAINLSNPVRRISEIYGEIQRRWLQRIEYLKRLIQNRT